jgi:threonine aldolase
MEKINLMNDYNLACHPRVLEAIGAASERTFVGYGLDEECAGAADMVRQLCGQPDADVHFMTGGTLTNLTALSAFLRPHEAVVAPAAAHIYVHETGAIEATGHKILTVPAKDGKAFTEDVRAVCEAHTDEHMVRPKLLYISQTTELGTVYTKAELRELRRACDEFGMYFYIDGARLGYALASEACDLTLPELASLADAFYIGGTKNGLLFGEAIVIRNPSLAQDFRHLIKQRGGLLSKGFLLGIQFRAILEDGLYFELARQANEAASKLACGLGEKGIPLLTDTLSNQVFPIALPDTLKRLEEHVHFEVWAREREEGTPIRFVTTWKTTDEEISAVLALV